MLTNDAATLTACRSGIYFYGFIDNGKQRTEDSAAGSVVSVAAEPSFLFASLPGHVAQQKKDLNAWPKMKGCELLTDS